MKSFGRVTRSLLLVFLAVLVFSAFVARGEAVSPAETASLKLVGETRLWAAVIDQPNGYAYFGTYSGGNIVKVRLSDFTRVDKLALGAGETAVASGVIDQANGFAYFATGGNPSIIVKVDVNPAHTFAEVGSITLAAGEYSLDAAVIDPPNGFAYFIAAGTTPRRVIKIDINPSHTFQKISTLVLNTGEYGNAYLAAVAWLHPTDLTSRFLYLSVNPTSQNSDNIVKVNINPSNFVRVGAISLTSTEGYIMSAVVDQSSGYAYFGTWSTGVGYGSVVKVDVNPSRTFQKVGTGAMSAGENSLNSAVIDTTNHFAYFGTATSPGIVVKVNAPTTSAAPSRVTAITLNAGEKSLQSAVIDQPNGYAYFGTDTSAPYPALVVKMNVSPSGFARVGALALRAGSTNLWPSVIDQPNGFAYLGMNTIDPSIIVKVRLSDFTYVDSIILNTGEGYATAAVIDQPNGYAYFATGISGRIQDKIVKIDVNPAHTFQRVDAITLLSHENYIQAAVIDQPNGFAYFGTGYYDPAAVVKVDVNPAHTFARVGVVTLAAGEQYLYSAAIDQPNGFAYFGTGQTPGKVVKINLSTFTKTGTITMATGENNLDAAVIDQPNHFAYFGTGTSPGKVVKINLSTFIQVTPTLTLATGENSLSSGVIDQPNHFAYFGTYTSPGKVVQINLSSFAEATPTLTLGSGENQLEAAMIDQPNGYAYFGTYTSSGILVKVNIRQAAQYQMTVSYSISGGGSPTAPKFSYVQSGVSYQYTLTTTPTAVSCDSGSTWSVTPNPLTGSTSSEQWYSIQTLSGTVSASQSLSFAFYHQYLQTLSYSVLGGGSPTAPTYTANQNGVSTPQALTTTATGYWYDNGASWSVTTPLSGSTGSEQWVTSQSTSGTISSASTTGFFYQHQYLLTMAVSPTGGGTTSPAIGNSWQNAAAILSISATANTGYSFSSWTGTGSGSYSGTNNPSTNGVTMNAAITETANFVVQYSVTFTSSGISTDTSGTVVTVNGVAKTQSQLPFTASYNSGSSVTYSYASTVSATTGKQYVWSSTSGLGQALQSNTFSVSAAGTVTGTYGIQYRLTVTSAQDSPTGAGWYNSGTSVSSSVISPVSGGTSIQYVCTGWIGTGSAPASGSGTSTGSFTITQASSVTWNWKTQHYITVTSLHGTPTASDWVDSGQDYPTSVTSPSGDYRCDGYKIDSGALTAGTSYTFTNVQAAHTIDYQWSLNVVSITVTSSPTGSGYVTVDSVAYATPQTFSWTIGSQHTLEALSPVDGGAGVRYAWLSWSDIGSQSHQITVPVSSMTYTANYATQYQLTMATAPQNGGTTSPAVGSYWYDSGSSVNVTASPAEGYVFVSWSDEGAQSHQITMSQALTLTASFAARVTMTVSYAVIGGGIPTAPTLDYVQSGESKQYALTETATPILCDPDSDWSVTPNPLGGSDSNERWLSGQALSGTASTQTMVFSFQHQYMLTTGASPQNMGSAAPATGWQDAGATVSISASAGQGFVFHDWSGGGPDSYSGTSNPVNVTINGPIMELAEFGMAGPPQVTMTISFAVLSAGSGYSAPIFKYVQGGTNRTYTLTETPYGVLCDGGTAWFVTPNPLTGSGQNERWISNQTLTGTASIQAIVFSFQHQYQLTMLSSPSAGGTASASGWQNAGASVGISATANPNYTFQSWTGSGSGSYTGTNNPAAATMSAALSETANFVSGSGGGTTVQLLDSKGIGVSGGSVQYYRNGWQNGGTTDSSGRVALQLQPAIYYFSMTYANARQEKGPLTVPPSGILTVTFQTTLVTVELRDSTGSYITGASGTVQYYAGGWRTFGSGSTSGGKVSMELLPLSYYFSMTYANARLERGPVAVSSSPTVTFQTVLVTVELRDSTGVYITGSSGTVQYYAGGWRTFGSGTTSGGTVSMELLPVSYYFSMTYAYARQERGPLAVSRPGPFTVTFITSLVTVELRDSTGAYITATSGTVQYYAGGWRTFGSGTTSGGKVTMQLLPVRYYFSMAYGNARQENGPMTVLPSSFTVSFQTVLVTVELRDSTGAYITTTSGTVQYYAGGWRTFGTGSTSGGKVSMELLPLSYYFSMNYANARQEKGAIAVPSPGPFAVSFQTVLVTVELRDSTGAYITATSGTVQYYAGGWRTFGSGSTSGGTVSMELLPVSYYFSMNYVYARQERGPLSITSPGPFVVSFQTVPVTVELKDSTGAYITASSGTVQYYAGGWHMFGSGTTSGGTVSVELLPASYYFSMTYAYARQEKGPLSVPQLGSLTVSFQTVPVTVELKDSTGAYITATSGTVQYYASGWHPFGSGVTAGGVVSVELLPANYYFSMTYAYARQEKGPLTVPQSGELTVSFQTVLVAVELRDSTGTYITATSGTVQYYAGGWRSFGSGTTSGGTVSVELLPANYYFSMTYAYARQEKGSMAVSAPGPFTVSFNTVLVTVELRDGGGNGISGGTAQYYAGGWRSLGVTDGSGQVRVELLPVSYYFSMTYSSKRQEKGPMVVSSSTVVSFTA